MSDVWMGLAIFATIVGTPALVVLALTGLREMWERAYLRGSDDAWQRAVDAQACGKRLV